MGTIGEFEVINASQKKVLPAKEGKKEMQVIALVLKDDGQTKGAEWFTPSTTELPAVGSKLEGELEESSYGLKFKKARSGGGGWGGGRGNDPEVQRYIIRQHSQKCAVDLIRVAHDLGLVKPKGEAEAPLERVSELAEMVKAIAHNLESDVYRTE